MEVELISFSAATKSQIDSFANIAADKNIMKNIGNGQIWSREKISGLVAASIEDDSAELREWFHWMIIAGGKVVGYVGIHPWKEKSQIRLFVKPQRAGIGRAALQEFSRIFRGEVYALINLANVASIGLFTSTGWTRLPDEKIYGKNHAVFMRGPIFF